MNLAQALHDLRSNPAYFLKYYPINLAGMNNGLNPDQANSRPFFIFKTDNPGAKAGHFGATRPGTVFSSRTHEISSFNIGTAPLYNGLGFNALAVPMVYYDQIANIAAMDAYLLDNSETIMITGQLSNCCFCIVPTAGGLACAHVNPRGAAGPVQLQSELAVNGRFANYPGRFVTFGRQNYAASAIVIGVRAGGAWNIFAQQSNDMFHTLTRADRIYPQPMTAL